MNPLTLLVASFLCLAHAAHAQCVDAQLIEAAEAIALAPKDRIPRLMTAGIHRACKGWPKPILKALDNIAKAEGPSIEAERRALRAVDKAWQPACDSGTAALKLTERSAIYAACGPLSGISKDRFATGTGTVFLPWLVDHRLTAERIPPSTRSAVLSALTLTTAVPAPAEQRSSAAPSPAPVKRRWPSPRKRPAASHAKRKRAPRKAQDERGSWTPPPCSARPAPCFSLAAILPTTRV